MGACFVYMYKYSGSHFQNKTKLRLSTLLESSVLSVIQSNILTHRERGLNSYCVTVCNMRQRWFCSDVSFDKCTGMLSVIQINILTHWEHGLLRDSL
jgi:hypothetical protein